MTYSRHNGLFTETFYNFHLSCLKFNLKISIHKTKATTLSKKPLLNKFQIDGRMIEQVIKFCYLGVNITSSGNLVKEIKTQTQEWPSV